MFSNRAGWRDVDADARRHRDAQAAEQKRRETADHAGRQANAPETIRPTGKHHRK